jgi:serine/threonine protein kinase
MLKKLSSLEDPHIITLLATLKHGDKYCLIFPKANANLRKFWEQRPAPQFDGPTVLWMVEQMAGIVHALSRIHNFSEEDLYGRHGDLKAENILWFSVDPRGKSSIGILKIADFGLGKFHRQDSRSRSIRASGTIMYLPPEAQLNMSISRAGDIWSLACLYLEFISWVLTGSADIDGISVDSNFFQLLDGTRAIVRHEVVAWVQQLREHPRCSALIHNLLDLIMDDALIPDAQKRIGAPDLWEKLKILLNKSREDQSFLLEGALWHSKSEPAPTSPQSAIPADDVTGGTAGTPPRPRRVQTFPPPRSHAR